MIVHAANAPSIVEQLVAGKGPVDGAAAAWVCKDFQCQRPETDPARVAAALEQQAFRPRPP